MQMVNMRTGINDQEVFLPVVADFSYSCKQETGDAILLRSKMSSSRASNVRLYNAPHLGDDIASRLGQSLYAHEAISSSLHHR